MIDWNALGTWSAVVVALGISLRDTWDRRRQRTARHLLTSAQILPDIGRLRDALALTLDETETLTTSAPAERLQAASDTFAARLNGMGLLHLKAYADQVDALPETMLIPLVKAITVSDMMLENHVLRRRGEQPATPEAIREEFEEWREQSVSIKASLDWVIQGAEKRMRSRRWQSPEWWE